MFSQSGEAFYIPGMVNKYIDRLIGLIFLLEKAGGSGVLQVFELRHIDPDAALRGHALFVIHRFGEAGCTGKDRIDHAVVDVVAVIPAPCGLGFIVAEDIDQRSENQFGAVGFLLGTAVVRNTGDSG